MNSPENTSIQGIPLTPRVCSFFLDSVLSVADDIHHQQILSRQDYLDRVFFLLTTHAQSFPEIDLEDIDCIKRIGSVFERYLSEYDESLSDETDPVYRH